MCKTLHVKPLMQLLGHLSATNKEPVAHMNWAEWTKKTSSCWAKSKYSYITLKAPLATCFFNMLSCCFIAMTGGSVIVNILIAKFEGNQLRPLYHSPSPPPVYRQWEMEERHRETFWLFGFTLKHGKEPIAEQREDKLSGDLPSRSSLDRLDVILFNLSTSSRHEEDRTGLTSCHRAVPMNAYLCSLTFKHVKPVHTGSADSYNTIYLHSVETRSAYKL